MRRGEESKMKRLRTFKVTTELPHRPFLVHDYHTMPGAFERLMTPWEHVRVVRKDPTLTEGAVNEFKVRLAPFVWRTWLAEHRDVERGKGFVDDQRKGPFAYWSHRHVIVKNKGGSLLQDDIEYSLPLGKVGDIFGRRMVRSRLEKMFEWRSTRLSRDLAEVEARPAKKKVMVTGSSGMLGPQLCSFLRVLGHKVTRATRKETKPLVGEPEDTPPVEWDPYEEIPPSLFEGYDAVIHLGGVNIGEKRWSQKRRSTIRRSREIPTRHLAEALASLDDPPMLICGSAIGWYGSRGEERLTESSEAGTGFLSKVCQSWEGAAEPAIAAGVRTVFLRTGIVLWGTGGVLERLLLPFLLGLGGPISGGNQYMSWIHMDDWVRAVHFLLQDEEAEGAYNLTAPSPKSNGRFTRILGDVLKRPCIAPVPGFAITTLFGDMGKELIVEGQHVRPKRLIDSGFKFVHPALRPALREVLGRE